MITYIKNGTNGLLVSEKWEPNCWIQVENPSESDKNHLIDELNIPLSFYNDINDIDERPRFEIEDEWSLIIIRVPIKTSEESLPFSTIPLGIMFKEDVFVSLSFHSVEMLSDFVKYTQRKLIVKKNNFDLVLRLLLSSSIWFLKYLKQINQRIKLAEKQLEKSIQNEDLQTLIQIEKSMVYFTTSLKGNDILIHKIKNLRWKKENIDEELLEDVEIELRQALETTNIYSDILSGMMDAYASVISNNLNVILKLLTSISILLMIPTLIASFYGMNVPNVFEDNHYGFWLVILISFLISGIALLAFKKKNWI
ncbi:MAG: magnesium transporter CorA family protein [bacterium]|nr:magnesium transporter CorA family protein [bacterium]